LKNLNEFRSQGFISAIEAHHLEAILDMGHAAIHRGHIPERKSIVAAVDIAEALVKRLYIDPTKVASVKEATPLRKEK